MRSGTNYAVASKPDIRAKIKGEISQLGKFVPETTWNCTGNYSTTASYCLLMGNNIHVHAWAQSREKTWFGEGVKTQVILLSYKD